MRKRLLILIACMTYPFLGHAAYRASVAPTRVRAKQPAKVVKAKKTTRTTASARRRTRRIPWNPALPGSHESMLKQNEEIDAAGLQRIENDEQLQWLIEQEVLVPVSASNAVMLNPSMHADRRTARPAVRDFVEDLGSAYYAEFHQPIAVTSLVRTAEQQRKLRRRNKNAAPIDGDTASSHLAGTTVDIGKRGMTKKQHAFIDQYLGDLKEKNLIEPAEERRQACYHIMVFDRYQNWRDDQALSKVSKTDATATPEK